MMRKLTETRSARVLIVMEKSASKRSRIVSPDAAKCGGLRREEMAENCSTLSISWFLSLLK